MARSDAIPMNVYVSAFYMDTNLVSYSQWQRCMIGPQTTAMAF